MATEGGVTEDGLAEDVFSQHAPQVQAAAEPDETEATAEASAEGAAGADAEPGHQPLALHWAARTDVGLVRSSNQDSVFAGDRLLAVADGMGGMAAGDVA